jgi:inhibitor of KinA
MGPRYTPVADHAVLVGFDGMAEAEAQTRVLHLDAALRQSPVAGVVECVPAMVSVLVCFDAQVTDHAAVTRGLQALAQMVPPLAMAPATHVVPVCYDTDVAPDLAQVAAQVGISVEAVIAAHLAGDYAVFMYGFAPGYAYLTGVPQALHLPRKPAARRGVAAGSVIIAGGQCLITTLVMPTGWWVIGQSPLRVLRDDAARPFLFDVGDRLQFTRITRAALGA